MADFEGKHNTCGARGVHDGCRIISLWWHWLGRLALAQLVEGVPAVHINALQQCAHLISFWSTPLQQDGGQILGCPIPDLQLAVCSSSAWLMAI